MIMLAGPAARQQQGLKALEQLAAEVEASSSVALRSVWKWTCYQVLPMFLRCIICRDALSQDTLHAFGSFRYYCSGLGCQCRKLYTILEMLKAICLCSGFWGKFPSILQGATSLSTHGNVTVPADVLHVLFCIQGQTVFCQIL